MASGLYWCLVLTECLSLVICGKCILLPIYHCISTASLTQTTPPYSPVCPGGRLVFTCVTDVNMGAFWRVNNGADAQLTSTSPAAIIGSFSVRVAKYNSTTLVTNATIKSVSVQLNGSSIGCSGDLGNNYKTLYISIAGIFNIAIISELLLI